MGQGYRASRKYNKEEESFDNRSVKQLLNDQLLILKHINSKLTVVNYIKDGHAKGLPIVSNNPFILQVAQVYFRSLIIDFTALFGKNKTTDKNSLQLLYDAKYKNDIGEDRLKEVRNILGRYKPDKNPVKRLVNLRNKEVAHYDPTAKVGESGRVTVSFNWDYVEVMNELFAAAEGAIITGLEVAKKTFKEDVEGVVVLDKIIQDLVTLKG